MPVARLSRVLPRVLSIAVTCALIGAMMVPVSLAQGRTRVRQVGFRVLYMAPIYLAIEKGFFNEEGLDMQYVEIDSGILGPAALVSGQAQFADTDPLQVGLLKKEGKELLMVYNLVRRVTLDFIMRNDVVTRLGIRTYTPIKTRFAALKGLRIGITRPGAPTDIFPRYFLIQAGFNPDRDAHLVQVGGVPALGAALRAGRIDGFMLSPPLPQTLEREGVGKIMIRTSQGDVPELADVTYVANSVSADYARKNPKVVAAYVRALNKANTWMRANRNDALAILREKYFKDTPADTLGVSWDALLPAISKDGVFTEKGIAAYLDVFRKIGKLDFEPQTREGIMWTNQFVK